MPSSNLDEQEQALLSLVQDSNEGRAWSASLLGWSANSGTPVCSWDGVTCGFDNTVTEVDLSERGLSGTIPSELGLLSDLEVLRLKKNILDGSIPQEIANLKRLVTLDLTEAFLTGTLPQRFESPVLTSLLLANNAISGRFFQTDDSPHLQSIMEIRMENNLLTGTLHGLSLMKMPLLQTLSLSDNDLSGLIPGEELGSLPTLHYLYLDSNHFIGPLPTQLAQVGQASMLELWVQDNALSGTVPASYVRFDKLHDFFIDGNKLTGALPPDLCSPQINSDFFQNVPPEAERNYCDSIACPAGSVAFEGVYPCEQCPGGEAARLKNRYLGQTGKCSDFSQRDVLKIFYKSTTKGGPWKGVSDWADENKPTCDMTGITCDAHNHIVEISLKNRGLEGHLPDEIGQLSFLETLDVSDNSLMGYIPSDLQWTSMTRLDISGNKIRGMVPPLLCMKEELNGNGEGNVFYCDRIACPEGTYNSYGFHHGVHGETCEPCYDETPFIAQKACTIKEKPSPKLDWREKINLVKETSEEMGLSPKAGLAITLAVLILLLIICCLVAMLRSDRQKEYDQGATDEEQNTSGLVVSADDKAYNYYDEEEEDDADYTFGEPDHPRYGQMEYRDFVISDDNADEEHNVSTNMEGDDAMDDDEDDDNRSRMTARSARSATDLVSDHQGVALNRRERIKKAVSGHLSGDISRRAREAASSINVGARRLSQRRKSLEGLTKYADERESTFDEGLGLDLELTDQSAASTSTGDGSSLGKSTNGKHLQPSDLLDVPMIT